MKKNTDFDITSINMDELEIHCNPIELKQVLRKFSKNETADIILDNLLYHCVERELFEYACVIRDEINKRK